MFRCVMMVGAIREPTRAREFIYPSALAPTTTPSALSTASLILFAAVMAGSLSTCAYRVVLAPDRPRLPAVRDCRDDLWRQELEPQHTAEIGPVDLLGRGQFGDAGALAAFEHALLAMRPS